jgi:hypothetical protein
MEDREDAGLYLRPDMVEPAYILFDGKGGGDEADFSARPWNTSSTAC